MNLLNYLIGKENIEDELIKLVREYPKVRAALPLLVAVRADKLRDMPIISDLSLLVAENKSDIFYGDTINEKELLVFFQNSGIKGILQNKNVKNLVDYCFGVEVGMDTNARKNRTGTLMENLVGKYLIDFCKQHNELKLIEEATKIDIKNSFGIQVETGDTNQIKNDRRFDFVIYNSKTVKLYIFEANYYSSQGSKPNSIAREYRDLNDILKKQGISFIWVTDGKGWEKMLNALEQTFNHNDYVLNLSMLKSGILETICLK